MAVLSVLASILKRIEPATLLLQSAIGITKCDRTYMLSALEVKSKFLLHLAILVKFLVLGIFSISPKYTFLKAVFFKYFWPKLPKIFASKFCDCFQSWTSHKCNLVHFGEVRYNMVQIGAVWFGLVRFGAKLV